MKSQILILLVILVAYWDVNAALIYPEIGQNTLYQDMYRQLVKQNNLKLIEAFNNDPAHSFKLRPNKFLALDISQFHALYTTTTKNHIDDEQPTFVQGAFESQGRGQSDLKGISLQNQTIFEQPSCDSVNVDLTIHASPVKDQGACNSCYAHSTLATVQSLIHQQLGIFYDLSEQQITQCTLTWAAKGFQNYNNQGCNGGWGWKSLHYIRFLGVTYEEQYPYVAKTSSQVQKCNEKAITGKRIKVSGYQDFYNKIWPQSQCNILNQKLQQGKTVAVSIFAPKGIQYQFYGTATQDIDIFNMCGPYQLVNHELQLVGSTDKYWKLKNSYGVGWGENGYLYLDKSKGLNCLNICMDFAFPTGLSSANKYI